MQKQTCPPPPKPNKIYILFVFIRGTHSSMTNIQRGTICLPFPMILI